MRNAYGQRGDGWLSNISFSFLLLVSSMSRIPVLEDLGEAKIFSFVFSILLLGYLIFTTRHLRLRTGGLLFISVVLGRGLYSIVVAFFGFKQEIVLSIMEVRFGLVILGAPFLYSLFWASDPWRWSRVSIIFSTLVILVDILIFFLIPEDVILSIGVRESSRVMISTIPSLVLPGITFVQVETKSEKRKAAFIGAVVCLSAVIHSLVVTTSRTELIAATLILIGYFSVLHLNRLINLLFVFILFIVVYVLSPSAGVLDLESGRDYVAAMHLVREVYLTGVGATRDNILRSLYNLSNGFFASDYGIFLYYIRYGIFFGSIMAASAILPIRYSLARGRNYIWRIMVGLAMVFYSMVVPMLDYNTLNGALLLAVSVFFILHESRRRRNQPSHFPGPSIQAVPNV